MIGREVAGSAVRVLDEPGGLSRIADAVREATGRRDLSGVGVWIASDRGVMAAGHTGAAGDVLAAAGARAGVFCDVQENPTTADVDAALASLRECDAAAVISIGGGSAMDVAKAANLLLTNGGNLADFWHAGSPTAALLPMIAVPTTAGTGSEAQSAALIATADSHRKMAIRHAAMRPRLAILDANLTATLPRRVAAATGLDAVTHAIESAAARNRTALSRELSREAWRLLEGAFDEAVKASDTPPPLPVRGRMLLGAHLAGVAIENAMLGAAHSCANALTAHYEMAHGVAVAVMLPHVIRFNATDGNPYADLGDAGALAARVEAMLASAGVSGRLTDHGVDAEAAASLAAIAATQWTAGFNPRPVTERDFAGMFVDAM